MLFGLEKDAQIEEQYDAQRYTPEYEDRDFNCWSNFIDIPGLDEWSAKIRQFQQAREQQYNDHIGRHYFGAD